MIKTQYQLFSKYFIAPGSERKPPKSDNQRIILTAVLKWHSNAVTSRAHVPSSGPRCGIFYYRGGVMKWPTTAATGGGWEHSFYEAHIELLVHTGGEGGSGSLKCCCSVLGQEERWRDFSASLLTQKLCRAILLGQAVLTNAQWSWEECVCACVWGGWRVREREA
jgi:hypothetical protein